MKFQELNKLLKKNGWVLVRVNGSHYQYRHPFHSGTATIPRHYKDVSTNIIKSLEKQTGLSFRR